MTPPSGREDNRYILNENAVEVKYFIDGTKPALKQKVPLRFSGTNKHIVIFSCFSVRLPLGPLEAFACALLPVFLTLFPARVPGKKTLLSEQFL